jgi:hypothetical protein
MITIRYILAIVLTSASLAQAQDNMITFDDFLEIGNQWTQENIDPNILGSLEDPNILSFLDDPNQAKVRQLLIGLQRQLQGEYVIDLASLKDAATVVLPLLETNDETQPYAAWLKTRFDYLELADQFKRTLPPPKVEPNQPPRPIPNPGPEAERKAWQKQIEKRSLLYPTSPPTLEPVLLTAPVA